VSNEISWTDIAGATEYALIRDRTNRVWSTSGAGAFETYLTASYPAYVIAGTEQGTATSYYTATMPSAIPAGVYNVVAKRQAGGSAVETDPTVGAGEIQWGGTAVVPLSDLASSGQIGQLLPSRPARGVMLPNFLFKMVSSADHLTPLTSGVISGRISKDGAAFGPLQSGAFTEVGLGWYKLGALTSGDLACGSAALVFTGVGISGGAADQRDFSLLLSPSSGYA
jgi:hypothetical protein